MANTGIPSSSCAGIQTLSNPAMTTTADDLSHLCRSGAWACVSELASDLPVSVLDAPLSEDGWRALHFAASADAAGAVAALIAAGATVGVRASRGSTPLHLAAWEGAGGALSALTKAGADACATTAAGRTPLHFAARRGHARLLAKLINAGGPVDKQEKDGQTGLHLAAAAGHTGFVSALVAAGANVGIRDAHGRTAADAATAAGHRVFIPSPVPRRRGPLQLVFAMTGGLVMGIASRARRLVAPRKLPALDVRAMSTGEVAGVLSELAGATEAVQVRARVVAGKLSGERLLDPSLTPQEIATSVTGAGKASGQDAFDAVVRFVQGSRAQDRRPSREMRVSVGDMRTAAVVSLLAGLMAPVLGKRTA